LKIVAFIFARSGSKGLVGKNTKLLNGIPLIAWSIKVALSVPRIDRVIVSTDSQEIADIALEYGAEVPFLRPKHLAQDDSPEWEAWRHALLETQKAIGKLPEVFVSLPPTSPLRSKDDIEKCLDAFEKGGHDSVITVTDSNRNPYFNMVVEDNDGNVRLASLTKDIPKTRQSAPVVLDMTTVCYVVKPDFILKNESLFEGSVTAVHVPGRRAIDIDTIEDFHIAEMYLNLNDFI